LLQLHKILLNVHNTIKCQERRKGESATRLGLHWRRLIQPPCNDALKLLSGKLINSSIQKWR